MSWVYVRSEPGLWTVGHYDPDGEWHSDSDHGSPLEAGDRCAYLNGSPLAQQLDALDQRLVDLELRANGMTGR